MIIIHSFAQARTPGIVLDITDIIFCTFSPHCLVNDHVLAIVILSWMKLYISAIAHRLRYPHLIYRWRDSCKMVVQLVKTLPAMQETLVRFLDQEDLL